MAELDITTQIKTIELLKCVLLSDMAALYENMRLPGRGAEDEPLANLITHTYLLARRLGFTFAQLEAMAAQNLRRDILSGRGGADKEALLTHWAGPNEKK